MSPLNITQPLGIWSIMATIRWCPIAPRWDIYQPLFMVFYDSWWVMMICVLRCPSLLSSSVLLAIYLALQLFTSRVGPSSSKRSMQKLHRSALHGHYTWRKTRSWDSWNGFGNSTTMYNVWQPRPLASILPPFLWHWRASCNAMMLESRSSKHHRWIWWRHPCTHW